MTSTTETYWDVNGVSLQTYAFNIDTLGGDRMSPPDLRGDDLVVPYMPGERRMKKIPGPRTITLGMWVVGANEDGTIPQDEAMRRVFDRNWMKLRKTLWSRRPYRVTKRMWVHEEEFENSFYDVSSLPQSGSFRLITVSAIAEFAGGLAPSMDGPGRASFTVDLNLADPYFYGAPISVPFSTATGGSNPGPSKTINVIGDDDTTHVAMDFIGPLTTPKFTATNPDGTKVTTQYGNVVAQAEHAVVSASSWTATHYTTGSSYKGAGYVTHTGDIFWMNLQPGENDVVLSKQAGTGTATLTYTPRWF
jgi:hypothetical protein